MDLPLDELRVAVLIVTLLYASYLDIKTRKVSDNVWVPGLIAGLVIVGYEAMNTDAVAVVSELAISVLVVGVIAYLLFRYRIFYGADYKAFVLIAVVMPVMPEVFDFPLYGYDIGSVDPRLLSQINITGYLSNVNAHIATQLFGFTVLVNSSLFGVVYFFMNAYHNIRNGNFTIKKPLRSTCARKVESSSVPESHVQVIPKVESENAVIRGFQFIKNGINGIGSEFYRDYLQWHRDQKFNSPSDEISDLDELDLEAFNDDSDEWVIDSPEEDQESAELLLREDMVWVTPGIPYIVPITLGVISAVFIGNIWYVVMLSL